MILQALAVYHDRLRDEGKTPPPGFGWKEIPFVVVISTGGDFVGLLDTRSTEGRRKRARQFVVPKEVKRASQILPNLLWDNPAYLFAQPKQDLERQRTRAVQQQEKFVENIRSAFPGDRCPPGVRAVLRFLEGDEYRRVFDDPLWPEIEASAPFLSFMLDGETSLVCEAPEVVEQIGRLALADTDSEPRGVCLVTGRTEPLSRLHTTIKGVRGAQSSGANIISFNLDAFCSYGKEQGFNAPVGRRAEGAYTTALNTLLGKDSRQKIGVGDTTAVFWAARCTPMEDILADLFGQGEAADPQIRDVDSVRATFSAPRTGSPPLVDDPTPFYVLGLAPNASRIAIRFWHTGTVAELAERILQYFGDILIDHHREAVDYPALTTLLRSTAVQGKLDNIAPNLAGETMAAILDGRRFPRALLATAVRRTRAERVITHPRAALIKAVLVRQNRVSSNPIQEVDVSLDPNNTNPGYRLGRLFAVLERAQERANPGINATIRDRYYGSASSTPVIAFPLLLKLNTHHLAKLENRGEAVNLGKRIGEIMDGLSTFPPHLNLDDQGRFAIGYYHQRQNFFQKSSDTHQGGDQ